MEKEYKWNVNNRADFDAIINTKDVSKMIINNKELNMEAVYYDTVNNYLEKENCTLRMRNEGSISVCCFKKDNCSDIREYKTRKEFEVEAEDIKSGIVGLMDIGAPEVILMKAINVGLFEKCKMNYKRYSYDLTVNIESGICKVELVFDVGEMISEKNRIGLCEIELEFISGNEQAFHKFAMHLKETYNLSPNLASKYQRFINNKSK